MSVRARVLLFVVVGAIVAGCAEPRPSPTPTAASPAAPSASPAAPSVAPSLAPSPAPSIAPSLAPSPAPSAAALVVEARDLSFTPKGLEASANQAFDLTLHNAGVIVHNLTIDAAGVQLVASPGQTRTTVVEGLAPGEYPFYCSVSGHREAGMSGTLIVR